jgi:acetoacetyl-CoA synthetase
MARHNVPGLTYAVHRDGVLNPSGIRFGSAEIYNVVRAFTEVEDSVCVGQRRPQDKDEAVMLFLKLKKGTRRTPGLIERLKQHIERDLSKRHIPKYIFYVDDIPYSGVGKKLEVVVKNIVCGRQVKSNVIANPESLELYRPYFDIEKIVFQEREQSAKL